MIEHEWYTSAQNHHPSLHIRLFLISVHIVLFLISAGIGTFFAWKVDNEYRVVITGDYVLFLPLRREASLDARNVRFSIHFSTQKKGLFHACVEKISIFIVSISFLKLWIDRFWNRSMLRFKERVFFVIFLKNFNFEKRMWNNDVFNCTRFFSYILWHKKEEKRRSEGVPSKIVHFDTSAWKWFYPRVMFAPERSQCEKATRG